MMNPSEFQDEQAGAEGQISGEESQHETADNGADGDDEVPVKNRVAELMRKMDKLQEENAEYKQQLQSFIGNHAQKQQGLSAEEQERLKDEECINLGWVDEDGNPDRKGFDRFVKTSLKFNEFTTRRQIAELEDKADETMLIAEDPNYRSLKSEVDNLMKNDPDIAMFGDRLTKQEKRKLAFRLAKERATIGNTGVQMNPQYGGRLNVGSSVSASQSSASKVKLTQFDEEIIRTHNLDRKEYIKQKQLVS